MRKEFDEVSIPFLFYRARNLLCIAGHTRLFGDRPGRGWAIYHYSEQAPGWALHRRWNFGLLCIHHVGPGPATDPEGWSVTFATLRVERRHRAVTLRIALADTFRTRRRRK